MSGLTSKMCQLFLGRDILVSWNFKHIVNLDRIRGYNGINYQNGYKMIEIRTPQELTKYGNED